MKKYVWENAGLKWHVFYSHLIFFQFIANVIFYIWDSFSGHVTMFDERYDVFYRLLFLILQGIIAFNLHRFNKIAYELIPFYFFAPILYGVFNLLYGDSISVGRLTNMIIDNIGSIVWGVPITIYYNNRKSLFYTEGGIEYNKSYRVLKILGIISGLIIIISSISIRLFVPVI